MAPEHELSAANPLVTRTPAAGTTWLFSWPLLVGLWVFLYSLYKGNELLLDGDTYWHIAAGQWMMRNGSVPTTDPFSHTMPGAAWTAHEWLSEVILAAAHQVGGWPLVVALTGLAFSVTVVLLARALLKWLEPIYVLLFAGLAVAMTIGHLLSRPHILAMPFMMIWTVELVRASEADRSPGWWLLPIMALWANLHGGFTLGVALACAFALEALLNSTRPQRVATGKSWGIFVALAAISALLTPHGMQGILFTWQVLFDSGYALSYINEWQSPDFHTFNSFELWLLAGFALVMHQGLRLPPIRLILLLGLLHLALKHVRYVELLGLLAPLLVAAPFASHWREAKEGKPQLDAVDRFFRRLAQPAGTGAVVLGLLLVLVAFFWSFRARPLTLPEGVVPARAVSAVQEAGIKGPVLNSYNTGGYLIYLGIPVFIDGRADMYGNEFLKRYIEAMELRKSDDLKQILSEYSIAWTLLKPQEPAVALLDHLPGWRRLYADKTAVVHVRVDGDRGAVQAGAR